MTETRDCQKCGETFPLLDFPPSKQHRDGRHPWCRECVRAKSQKWREDDPERAARLAREWRANNLEHSKELARRGHLRRRYGISLEQYQEMFDTQGGKCAVCLTDAVQLIVEHCHLTGKVRGLCCQRCNVLIAAQESPLFDAVAAYLIRAEGANYG